jgi:hypothetical protein
MRQSSISLWNPKPARAAETVHIDQVFKQSSGNATGIVAIVQHTLGVANGDDWQAA